MHHTLNRRDFLRQTAGVGLVSMLPGVYRASTQSGVNRTRYLLLDDRIVAAAENAKLTPGTVTKHTANPLFAEDKPWEKRIDNVYANVIYDEEEQIYKCWYSPFIVDHSALGKTAEERAKPYDQPENREMGICYATSEDGLVWEKPELDLVEFEGSKANNILWRGAQPTGQEWYDPHGTGIFKDLNDPDPKRRYKAFLKGDLLSVAFSSDGIHWSPAVPCPEANVRGDTHNNAFWAPTLGQYVGITREWGQTYGRQVARTTSSDFVNWTPVDIVLEGLDKGHQTYAMPVFYYAGVYLGLLALYDVEADRVWTELTWSPDTEQWHRIAPGTPFIPNSEEQGAYDWGCVYTAATPVFLKDEIRLYYGSSDGLHFGWRNGFFCLATLRPDGFAGYEPLRSDRDAIITTAPVIESREHLLISVDVREGGSVEVSIVDGQGLQLATCEPVMATGTDVPVRWRDTNSLDAGGKGVLRFKLADAKLYSFGIGE